MKTQGFTKYMGILGVGQGGNLSMSSKKQNYDIIIILHQQWEKSKNVEAVEIQTAV